MKKYFILIITFLILVKSYSYVLASSTVNLLDSNENEEIITKLRKATNLIAPILNKTQYRSVQVAEIKSAIDFYESHLLKVKNLWQKTQSIEFKQFLKDYFPIEYFGGPGSAPFMSDWTKCPIDKVPILKEEYNKALPIMMKRAAGFAIPEAAACYAAEWGLRTRAANFLKNSLHIFIPDSPYIDSEGNLDYQTIPLKFIGLGTGCANPELLAISRIVLGVAALGYFPDENLAIKQAFLGNRTLGPRPDLAIFWGLKYLSDRNQDDGLYKWYKDERNFSVKAKKIRDSLSSLYSSSLAATRMEIAARLLLWQPEPNYWQSHLGKLDICSRESRDFYNYIVKMWESIEEDIGPVTQPALPVQIQMIPGDQECPTISAQDLLAYDKNNNQKIEPEEITQVAIDFMNQKISRERALALLRASQQQCKVNVRP